jgi:hypothetical protein
MLLTLRFASGFQEGAREPGRMETYDDRLVRVERKAPGFGGMFTGEDGRLVVYLIDPSKIGDARSAIESVFGASHVPAAGVLAVRGRYTVSQLKRWAERVTELLEIPDVSIVDLDETRNRVAIRLVDASGAAAVDKALKSLKIPREAVVVEVIGPIRQLDPAKSKPGRPGPVPIRRPANN